MITCLEWQGMFDGESTIGVVAQLGGGIVLKFKPNPYLSREKPGSVGKLYEEEGEFWGIGISGSINGQQKASTDLLNAVIDAYFKYSRRKTYISQEFIGQPQRSDDSKLGIHRGC